MKLEIGNQFIIFVVIMLTSFVVCEINFVVVVMHSNYVYVVMPIYCLLFLSFVSATTWQGRRKRWCFKCVLQQSGCVVSLIKK